MTKRVPILLFIILLLPLSRVAAQRIVSLVPSATHILSQVGADSKVVGRTSYCPKPQEGTKTTIVGDASNVNLETIITLQPDIVIAAPYTKEKVKERLNKLHIRYIELPTAKDFDDICRQTLLLGEAAGVRNAAGIIVDEERAKVRETSKKGTVKLKAYIQVGSRPTFGATPDYFINDIICRSNMINILANGEAACTREEVIRRKPDVIIISTMGGICHEEAQKWRRQTDAVVIIADEERLCCPTPLFFRQTLEYICKKIEEIEP